MAPFADWHNGAAGCLGLSLRAQIKCPRTRTFGDPSVIARTDATRGPPGRLGGFLISPQPIHHWPKHGDHENQAGGYGDRKPRCMAEPLPAGKAPDYPASDWGAGHVRKAIELGIVPQCGTTAPPTFSGPQLLVDASHGALPFHQVGEHRPARIANSIAMLAAGKHMAQLGQRNVGAVLGYRTIRSGTYHFLMQCAWRGFKR